MAPPTPPGKSVLSMTGFTSCESKTRSQKESLRIEARSLNHRFLDIKLRLPREYMPADPLIRNFIQTKLGRGSIDVRIDRPSSSTLSSATPGLVQVNLELAQAYHAAVDHLVFKLGIQDRNYALEIAKQQDVCTRTVREQSADEIWSEIEPVLETAVLRLIQAREQEGARLRSILLDQVNELRALHGRIRARRQELTSAYPTRISDKIRTLFESLKEITEAQSLIETRISQELALLLDRTDIEEELQRFAAHLDHFEKTLNEGGQVGRKIEFILQELGRECNTLGNKAQDYSISEETLQIKVRLEQCREQCLNLE